LASIVETLTAARRHHQAGRLHVARQLYQLILQADPAQAQVWYLLGAVWASLGKLEVRAWASLALSSDWLWPLGRGDSPWYPTVRLFRQRRLGDWDEVFGRIAEALRTPHLASCDSHPRPLH
jgi:hypothetical protein